MIDLFVKHTSNDTRWMEDWNKVSRLKRNWFRRACMYFTERINSKSYLQICIEEEMIIHHWSFSCYYSHNASTFKFTSLYLSFYLRGERWIHEHTGDIVLIIFHNQLFTKKLYIDGATNGGKSFLWIKDYLLVATACETASKWIIQKIESYLQISTGERFCPLSNMLKKGV